MPDSWAIIIKQNLWFLGGIDLKKFFIKFNLAITDFNIHNIRKTVPES